MTLNTANLQKYQAEAKELLAAGFRTKAAQKTAHEAASRAFDVLTTAVKDVHLNEDRSEVAEAVYFAIPMYPHQWRAKHAEMIRADLPGAAQYIDAITEVVALSASIKAEPIVPKVKVERAPQAGDRIQYRGHCQCCGRIHAVNGGYVAQHGYKVKFHMFLGACTGHMYGPLEVTREATDRLVKEWLAAAAKADETAQALMDGKIKPLKAPASNLRGAELIDFDLAPTQQQQRMIQIAIRENEIQSRELRSHADAMERLASKVHGQPLQEVVIPGTK